MTSWWSILALRTFSLLRKYSLCKKPLTLYNHQSDVWNINVSITNTSVVLRVCVLQYCHWLTEEIYNVAWSTLYWRCYSHITRSQWNVLKITNQQRIVFHCIPISVFFHSHHVRVFFDICQQTVRIVPRAYKWISIDLPCYSNLIEE